MIIDIENLYFRYPHGREIFSGLDFSLGRGDRLGLVGHNGSGKTTLLHLIMGLIKPTGGRIKVAGEERRTEKDFEEVRRKIGLLFQDADDQLFCPSVAEDIAFGPLNLGKSQEETRRIVRRTCDLLGLNGLEEKITYRLSGGEKKLVALATLVAMEPECYLLDEPSAGLDEGTTARLLSHLRNHCDTYLIISHDRDFLKGAADRIYRLEGSRLTEVTAG